MSRTQAKELFAWDAHAPRYTPRGTGLTSVTERRRVPSRVVLVPVAYNLTEAEARDAAKQYRFLITVPSRAAQYLVTLGQAVASKSADFRIG